MSDSPPPPSLPDDLRALIARAIRADGQPPFSDGSLIDLATGERGLIWLDGVAAAIMSPTEAEFVVDPDARRRGQGRAMLHELLMTAPGDLLIWAHGDHPAARALARTFGLAPVRQLLQLRAAVEASRPGEVSIRPRAAYSTGLAEGSRLRSITDVAEGSRLRSITDGELDAWVALNARIFADHPEQGSVTRADVEALATEEWFDTDDFLVLWHGDELVGYCWMKLSPDSTLGEFYVVGVSPEHQGAGLGRVLVQAGLAHLAARGIHEASLYVEGDNTAALRLYRSFGFTDYSIDVQYRWRSEPDDYPT